MCGERLHANSLRGVVSSVKHVEAKLLRVEKRVVGALARDVSVEPRIRGLSNQGAARAGDDPYSVRALGAEGEEPRCGTQEVGEPLRDRRAPVIDLTPDADGDAVFLAERPAHRDPELAGEDRIVAYFRVKVEWQVRAIERHVAFQEARHPSVAPPCKGLEPAPKQAVV